MSDYVSPQHPLFFLTFTRCSVTAASCYGEDMVRRNKRGSINNTFITYLSPFLLFLTNNKGNACSLERTGNAGIVVIYTNSVKRQNDVRMKGRRLGVLKFCCNDTEHDKQLRPISVDILKNSSVWHSGEITRSDRQLRKAGGDSGQNAGIKTINSRKIDQKMRCIIVPRFRSEI